MASSRSFADTPLDLLVAVEDRALQALAEDKLLQDRLVEEDSLVKDKALLVVGVLEVPAVAVYWTEVAVYNHLL